MSWEVECETIETYRSQNTICWYGWDLPGCILAPSSYHASLIVLLEVIRENDNEENQKKIISRIWRFRRIFWSLKTRPLLQNFVYFENMRNGQELIFDIGISPILTKNKKKLMSIHCHSLLYYININNRFIDERVLVFDFL